MKFVGVSPRQPHIQQTISLFLGKLSDSPRQNQILAVGTFIVAYQMIDNTGCHARFSGLSLPPNQKQAPDLKECRVKAC